MGLNICVFGYGLMGKTHVEMYARDARIVNIEIVEPNENLWEKRELYADRISFTKTLPDANYDLASICTPTYLHISNLIEIADRTNAVLVEKPMALTSSEAREMQEIADKYDLILRCALVERFNPPIAELRKAYDGKQNREYEFTRISSLPEKGWYADKSKSGGPLLDLGIHDLDLLLWLTQSRVDSLDVSLDDGLYRVQLRMDSGDKALLTCGWKKEQGVWINEIIVRSGTLETRLPNEILGKERYPLAYQAEIWSFIQEALEREASNLGTPQEAIVSLGLKEIIEAKAN